MIYIGNKRLGAITFTKEVEKLGEEKTIAPTTNEQVVTPTDENHELTQVTVEAIQTEQKTVAPTTSAQTVTPTENKYFDKVIVEGVTSGIDANIQAENIKKDVSILGVTGTLEEGITPTGTLEITTNGTHDVTNYASANVNVAGSGGGEDMLQAMVDATNSCYYLCYIYQGSSLNLSRLNTTNVTTMKCMFSGCANLESLDLSNFDTSNLIEMEIMFVNCAKLKSLDLSNFDTSRITSMYRLFKECNALTSLNLSSFNTSNVTNMQEMFSGCANLESLDLSSFDTSKVTNVSGMFTNAKKLETVTGTIDLYSATNNVSNFVLNCTNLKEIKLKNIKISLTLGSGSTYGHLLTVDSLVNTIKELWDYSSGTKTYTLTMGNKNKAKLTSIYVKLITPTAEQIAADPYIESKMPCEVCESTGEGAMLITDYALAKNWNIT